MSIVKKRERENLLYEKVRKESEPADDYRIILKAIKTLNKKRDQV